jgi:hypothetical protein
MVNTFDLYDNVTTGSEGEKWWRRKNGKLA